MFGRIIGIFITLAVIFYLFHAMNQSSSSVQKMLSDDPAVRELQRALQSQAVNAKDTKSVQQYTLEQAQQIKDYQDQLKVPVE